MKNLLPLIFLLLVSYTNLKLEENYALIIKASPTSLTSKETVLWKDSTFALLTNVSNPLTIFAPEDIDKQIIETKLRWKDISMPIKCHLWRPGQRDLMVICDLRDDPKKFNGNAFSVDDYVIDYKDKKIKFISDSFNRIQKLPFLYSDEQEIDLSKEKDVYSFTFRTGLYNDKHLFLYNNPSYIQLYVPFDNCDIIEREMTCTLSRKKIESFNWFKTGIYGSFYYIMSFNGEYGIKFYHLAYDITFSMSGEKKKTDIYVEIQKLISNKEESNRYIAFKTNVTDISSIIHTQPILVNFKNIKNGLFYQHPCFFKKYENNNQLMFLCLMFEEKNVTLTMNGFDSPTKYTDLNQNYNFIISYPTKENITITDKLGSYILARYPDTLDFTSKNELEINIYGDFHLEHKYYLNPKSTNLTCVIIQGILNCKVPKSHFQGEQSGDYNLYYNNSAREKSMFYEMTPIKVIIPKGSGSNFNKINRIVFILILLLLL